MLCTYNWNFITLLTSIGSDRFRSNLIEVMRRVSFQSIIKRAEFSIPLFEGGSLNQILNTVSLLRNL